MIWPPPTAITESHYQRNIPQNFPLSGSKTNMSVAPRPKTQAMQRSNQGQISQLGGGLSGAPWTNPNQISVENFNANQQMKQDTSPRRINTQNKDAENNLEVKLVRLSHTFRNQISSPVKLKPQYDLNTLMNANARKPHPPKTPSIPQGTKSDSTPVKTYRRMRLLNNRRTSQAKSLPGTGARSLGAYQRPHDGPFLQRRNKNNLARMVVKIPKQEFESESDTEDKEGKLPPLTSKTSSQNHVTPGISSPRPVLPVLSPSPLPIASPSPLPLVQDHLMHSSPPPSSHIHPHPPQSPPSLCHTSHPPTTPVPPPPPPTIPPPRHRVPPTPPPPSPEFERPRITKIPKSVANRTPTPPRISSVQTNSWVNSSKPNEEKDDGCFTVLHYWLPQEGTEGNDMDAILV